MVLHMHTICGIDTDELLGYTTKKVVWIRDRWIGVFYYILIFLVINWVFVGQILWRNEQFLLKDVKGLPRMWAAHPTLKGCDPVDPDCKSEFRDLDELPYCSAFKGLGEGKNKAPCRYEDITTTTKEGEIDNKLFFPTSVELITEKRVCDPKAENSFSCENEYEEIRGSDCMVGNRMCRERGGKKNQFYHVADVKNFQVQFTSSYEQGNVHGTSLDHPGYLAVCPSLLRQPNVTRKWSDRLQNTHENACAPGTRENVMIPCAKGVTCARMTEFDVFEHSGVNAGVEDSMEDAGIKPEASFLAVASTADPRDELDSGSLRRARRRIAARREERQHRHRHGSTHDADDSESRAFSVAPDNGPAKMGELQHFILQHSHEQGGKHVSQTEEKEEKKEDSEDPAGLGKSSTPNEYTSPWGDIFKVGRLLQLSGANIDADYNFDGWTSRQAGTVLEVRAVYNNLYPFMSSFGYKQVQYHYEVTELPLPYMSVSMLADQQPADYPETRVYEVRHGVMIWFKVAGSFGVFNIVYLLLMLVTAFALFTTASTITDLVSIYLHPRKENFFHLKYEVSPDFSDMWKCENCGWFNWEADVMCMGVPSWQCPHTTPKCGALKPGTKTAGDVPIR